MAVLAATIQTIIIMYVFTWLAMGLMVARLVLRRYRGQKWDLSDYITMVCMACLLARMSFIHVVLIWGSNNLTAAYRHNHVFGQREIYERTVGSKLTVVNRTFYNTYIWLQKCVIMILYQRMLFGLHWAERVMKLYWAILAATYVVIQVVTFTDCRPLHLYWQVVPDAGKCSEALGQLIILGALNIFTDILLIILPMPTLFSIKRSLSARLRLAGLFSLGLFLVAITIIRLPLNFANGFAQVNRTTWASVEAFTAAFVANVPTLYTLRRRAPDPLSGNRSGVTTDSHIRTGDYGTQEGWRKMGSRSQVNAEHDSDKDILVDSRPLSGIRNKGITVTRSVELLEIDVDARSQVGVEKSWGKTIRTRDRSSK